MIRLLLATCFALLLADATPAATPKAPVDWSHVVTRNADGSFTVGNPKASLQVVEYLSLTCSHCALVAREADEPLRRLYIAPGKLGFTIQHAVRDRFDLVASLLARCTAPGDYYGAMASLFAHQDDWIYLASQYREPDGVPPNLAAEADAAGLPALIGPRALPPGRVAACLANVHEQDVLAHMSQRIWTMPGFPGTPVFRINGKQENAIRSWAELEGKIKAAMK